MSKKLKKDVCDMLEKMGFELLSVKNYDYQIYKKDDVSVKVYRRNI